MLVLSRKKNESIVMDGIKITVMEIRGEQVRLGIEAPATCGFTGRKCTTGSAGSIGPGGGREAPLVKKPTGGSCR